MSLTDGAVADLAQRVADEFGRDLAVHVRPSANDDPYRWGGHGWVVQIGTAADVWIPVDAAPEEASSRLRAALQEATGAV